MQGGPLFVVYFFAELRAFAMPDRGENFDIQHDKADKLVGHEGHPEFLFGCELHEIHLCVGVIRE